MPLTLRERKSEMDYVSGKSGFLLSLVPDID